MPADDVDPGIPRADLDLFGDDALDDPYPRWRALRDLGPLVWLPAYGVYAATRYDDVRRILDDHETFVSGEGVALNDVMNALGPGTTLMSDGASGVIVAATHAILSDPAVDRLKNCPAQEVIVTNTLPLSPEREFDKLTQLSIAPLVARAIREVFEDGSVTSMFDGHA